jgi:dipeptidyl-peptidase-4
MITPVMEPGKRYPVFFEHYGGPHVQVVNKGWASALAQAIVAKGYIYFEIDNRGSANRGVDLKARSGMRWARSRSMTRSPGPIT